MVAEEIAISERLLTPKKHRPIDRSDHSVETGQNLHLELKPVLRVHRALASIIGEDAF